MKKIILATVLAGVGSTAALAADLGARINTKAPAMMAPVSNWSGLYIGGNVGNGWGNGSTDILPSNPGNVFDTITLDRRPNGVLGGAQIGYNWQIGSIVTGLEADIQGSAIKGSGQTALVGNVDPGTASTSSELSWFGTVRGRFGVTVTPALLLYATGGLAYGQIRDSATVQINNPPFNDRWPASISNTRVGWTAGAGGEWMFAHNWSAKLEYIHVDLGNTSATATDITDNNDPLSDTTSYKWNHQYDIVRAGVNYHF
jgi:outer membrane immunogenic protein